MEYRLASRRVLCRVRQANKHEIAQRGDDIAAKDASIFFLERLKVSGQQFLGKGRWFMVAVCVFIVVVNIYEYFFPEPNHGYCAVGCAIVSCAETLSEDCPFGFFVIVCAAVRSGGARDTRQALSEASEQCRVYRSLLTVIFFVRCHL